MEKYNKSNVASFDVDPSKGFTELCNELQIVGGHLITNELKRNHEAASIKVVSRELHPPEPIWEAASLKEMGQKVDGDNVDVSWIMHCQIGTKGAELLDGLPHPVLGYDYCVSKGLDKDLHPYGACYHDLHDKKTTGVIEFLKMNDITTVIVGGLATDFCVRLTTLQLIKAGFNVVLNVSACRPVSIAGGEAALIELALAGAVICQSGNDLSKALGGGL